MNYDKSKIYKIKKDFENNNVGFDRNKFPERRLTNELGEKYKLEYLSLFVMWDYNRSVDNLVNNIIDIYQNNQNFFDVDYVSKNMSKEDIVDVTQNVNTRFKNRDAKYYYDNINIICEKYNKDWENLLKEANYNAPNLVEKLRKANFKTLKGDKLAPFYARVINDEYKELEGLWELDIPVDTHIRKLSKDIFNDKNLSDNEIRNNWEIIGEELDLPVYVIDGALWQIGYEWDKWGKEYWDNI